MNNTIHNIMEKEVIKANRTNTVGIIKINKTGGNVTKIPGYFNKKLLKKALKYLKSIKVQDISIAIKKDGNKESAMIIFYAGDWKYPCVCVAGKTRWEK